MVEQAPRIGHSITQVRRTYNKWVANETLEDFALRYTARRARKWSYLRVANTALGSISFLALEAIGGALTLAYGYQNAVTAIMLVGAILFLTALPISYHAAKAGVDIDLLTRGAGFGYLGSTVTSLIYASFTFIFFALEAAILAQALELVFGLPLGIGYLVNALVVIPLVTHGFTRIGVFQAWSQPFWVLLQIAPFVVLFAGMGGAGGVDLAAWTSHTGRQGDPSGALDLLQVAAATGIALALIAQIGEQVDFLRFLPEPRTRADRWRWWAALIAAGPGWAVIGTLKMLAGSFLAVLILEAGVPAAEAVEPTKMYIAAFERMAAPEIALLLACLFVLLAQLKINVTNAYAGSIAWSNFFARLTHSHPGRVVWLFFNVAIALMLMEFGVFAALEKTLAAYSHLAVAWIGALTADLVINRPLGLRPPQIEFRRGYLYDINPVGVFSTLLATAVSLGCFLGLFGATAAAFSSLIALAVAMIAAPAIAGFGWGRYLARTPQTAPPSASGGGEKYCAMCEHRFDPEDMIDCPFHAAAICSLCCSLESRCKDACRPEGHVSAQAQRFAERHLPPPAAAILNSRYGVFFAVFSAFALVVGAVLLLIYSQAVLTAPESAEVLGSAFALTFGLMAMIVGVAAWLHTLAHESRARADEERQRQTSRLLAEIRAHSRTDAELQRAKEIAESANEAKSRYLVGISHELRTPLNAILGYAQLMEGDPSIPEHRRGGMRIVRRSSEHLADLIEGLLDISKIEAGRIEIYRNEINFREMLEQMAAVFRMEAAEKDLRFEFCVAPPTPDFVYADERRVRQILLNLLSNAVRYTNQGAVRFEVDYRNEIATITVSDTGCGISREDQDRIFEPFARVSNPSATAQGTGLGLTITKLLVELLGGDLQLDSTPGEGSVFKVRLMLPRCDKAPIQKQTRRLYGYRGPRRLVLVVDDNTEHRLLLEEAMKPLGFDVAMAESAEAALAIIDVAAPDIALVDVAMPGMSGWELVETLRKQRGFTAPIVMISAHAGDQLQLAPPTALHDDFLAKPVIIDTLLERIALHLKLEWLQESETGEEAAQVCAPNAVLEELDELIAIGHVRGASRALERFCPLEPAEALFVSKARARIEQVDLVGLSALVAEARRAG